MEYNCVAFKRKYAHEKGSKQNANEMVSLASFVLVCVYS